MKYNMMKRVVFVAICLLMIVQVAIPVAFAYDYSDSSNGYQIIVDDMAGLLYDEEISRIVECIEDEFDGMHYNVLILTVDDANGKSTLDYADDYMDELFSSKNNIGFVIDMDNREIQINPMGNATKCLTDTTIDSILDTASTYATSENYYSCFRVMIADCAARMDDDPTAVGYDNSNVFVDGLVTGLLPAGIVTIITVFVLLKRHSSANKAQTATAYVSREDYEVIDKDEIFVRSYETRIKDAYKQRSSSSGGGHHGGSIRTSSSGRSHGGGSRKF